MLSERTLSLVLSLSNVASWLGRQQLLDLLLLSQRRQHVRDTSRGLAANKPLTSEVSSDEPSPLRSSATKSSFNRLCFSCCVFVSLSSWRSEETIPGEVLPYGPADGRCWC